MAGTLALYAGSPNLSAGITWPIQEPCLKTKQNKKINKEDTSNLGSGTTEMAMGARVKPDLRISEPLSRQAGKIKVTMTEIEESHLLILNLC